jgi:hypothetical protein
MRIPAPITATLAALALSLAAAPSAAAAPVRSVSPGDEIVTTADAGAQQCTLGYTFTSPTTPRAYGIHAGHCNANRSRYVTDRTTGAIGRFVLTVHDPNRPLADDYGLIDFGVNRATAVMYGTPVTGISAPDPNNAVCHDGIRTGIACGALHSRMTGAATQYTTTGMPPSIPGDSGGPVWQLNNNNTATVIGIWLGEHLELTGEHYGRFTGLTDVLADIATAAGLTVTQP